MVISLLPYLDARRYGVVEGHRAVKLHVLFAVNGAWSRQDVTEQAGNQAAVPQAVSGDLPGGAAARELLVQMGRIEIPGDLAKQDDIVSCEGALQLRALAHSYLVIGMVFNEFGGHRSVLVRCSLLSQSPRPSPALLPCT